MERLLHDPEWSQWSDNKIAEICKVSHQFVGKLRDVTCNITSENQTDTPKSRMYATKHGTVSYMKTGNIGKASPRHFKGRIMPPVGESRGRMEKVRICAGAVQVRRINNQIARVLDEHDPRREKK